MFPFSLFIQIERKTWQIKINFVSIQKSKNKKLQNANSFFFSLTAVLSDKHTHLSDYHTYLSENHILFSDWHTEKSE